MADKQKLQSFTNTPTRRHTFYCYCTQRFVQDQAIFFLLVDAFRDENTEVISSSRIRTLLSEGAVAEAAVVGVGDATTGQAVAAFVIPAGAAPEAAELRDQVATAIGAIAKPRHLVMVDDLPKTRSGKIMRRLLVDLFERRPLGDTTSLQDDTVPDRIAATLAADPR